MNHKLTTIDPNQGNIPNTAIIKKVVSENDRLPNGEHEKAVKAFYFSDSIASGIGKDFAFVEKIPQLISDIIDNKSWECLYISRGVVNPYYCRYTKGTDAENFRAFIAAKRPNGLETSIETIDRLLEAESETQWKFRSIIYESRQGERNDLVSDTSDSDYPKSDDNLKSAWQKRLRAANRAAEAIPEIRELLDRGLIAIDVAAKLGRDIKDPDNLTAEEREYIDKRDLVGYRINQYINTNIMPEDEDKEPAYRRQLNEYVKDLLGIKNRSKTVRMDNPKKAAEKLLKFYEGQKLKELVEYLNKALNKNQRLPTAIRLPSAGEPRSAVEDSEQVTDSVRVTKNRVLEKMEHEDSQKTSHGAELNSAPVSSSTSTSNAGLDVTRQASEFHGGEPRNKNESSSKIANNEKQKTISKRTSHDGLHENKSSSNETANHKKDINADSTQKSDGRLKETSSVYGSVFDTRLTQNELAQRLGVKSSTIADVIQKRRHKFTAWSQSKDPESIGWTRTQEKRGRSFLFAPVQKNKEVD